MTVTLSAGMLALISIAGGVGAAARFLVDRAVRSSAPPNRGLWVVSVLGSFLAGCAMAFAAARVDPTTVAWLSVATLGVLGGFTTFSTVAVEAIARCRAGDVAQALALTVGMLVVAVGAAGLGASLCALV